MIVDVGAAVDADDAPAAVGVADADGWDLRWNHAPRNDADPGLVAQNGVGFSGEDGLRQAVGDIPRARAGIPIKRPVDDVHFNLRANCDRFRNSEIDGIRRRAIPRPVLTRVQR